MLDKRLKNYSPVPTILQMEATECGVVCLDMILASYKSFISLEQLRVDCDINRDGSKLSKIKKAAIKYGLNVKAYKTETDVLMDIHMPCLIHWNFNHFVVLEGFKKGKVYINDPVSGKRIITYDELDNAYTGVVMTFEPGEEYKPIGAEPKLSKALRSRLKGSENILFYIVLTGLFLIIPGLAIPTFSKVFVDDILLGGRTDWIGPLIWGMLVTAIVMALLIYWQDQFLLKMQTKIALITSSKFIWHIFRLPIEFFSQRQAGDLTKRIESNDNIAYFLSGELAKTAINVVLVGFYLALMFSYNVRLTIVGILLACVNIVYLRFASKKRATMNAKLQQDKGSMYGTAMQGLQIIETLKASGAEGDFFSKLMGTHAKTINGEQYFSTQTAYLKTLPAFMTALSNALVLIVGGLDVMEGSMTIGTLVAFNTLMVSFMAPINTLMSIGTKYQEMRADMNRLDDVLKYKTDPVFDQEETEEERQSDENNRRLKGCIDIEGLTFGYSTADPPLIENFDLHLKPGMRVALVGKSGSGKSTIAKLISGVHTPWRGTIAFDGTDKKDLPRRVITNSLSAIDQDICIFADTIENNLTLWDEMMPEDIMIKASKDAEIYSSIIDKKDGFQHLMLEGGSDFSEGQRQRIEIARALTNSPSILILDEATSALDPLTEKHINENIRERGCTCIIAAHRLSTIRDCDEIIVLDKGKIAERGTHDELKENNGIYTDLIETT